MVEAEGTEQQQLQDLQQGEHDLPDRQHQEDEYGESHLQVGIGVEAEGTEQQQLQDLQQGEHVDLALRNVPDVVIRWICGLKNTDS